MRASPAVEMHPPLPSPRLLQSGIVHHLPAAAPLRPQLRLQLLPHALHLIRVQVSLGSNIHRNAVK